MYGVPSLTANDADSCPMYCQGTINVRTFFATSAFAGLSTTLPYGSEFKLGFLEQGNLFFLQAEKQCGLAQVKERSFSFPVIRHFICCSDKSFALRERKCGV